MPNQTKLALIKYLTQNENLILLNESASRQIISFSFADYDCISGNGKNPRKYEYLIDLTKIFQKLSKSPNGILFSHLSEQYLFHVSQYLLSHLNTNTVPSIFEYQVQMELYYKKYKKYFPTFNKLIGFAHHKIYNKVIPILYENLGNEYMFDTNTSIENILFFTNLFKVLDC